MRRKLIKQDAFDHILGESAAAAEHELAGAGTVLAKALSKDDLALHCFNESGVLYATPDNSYVHAGYEIKNGQVAFNNIEELVIDEGTRKQKMRGILGEMLDLILTANETNNHQEKAGKLFNDYLGMTRWDEAKKNKGGFPFKKKGKKKGFPFKKGDEESDDKPEFLKKHDEAAHAQLLRLARAAGKDVAGAYQVARNVLEYVEYMKVGPSLAEAAVRRDDKGNLVAIRIPGVRLRNESRLHRIDWKTLNAKVAESRKLIPALADDQRFCKALAELRRQDSFSDGAAVEETVTAIVQHWPTVLYATQAELSHVVAESLKTAGVENFGDENCEFLADAILRKAHDLYTERAGQILHLASAPKPAKGENPYDHFQAVVEQFYPRLDEKFGLERQAFIDLYDSLGAVYKKAQRQNDQNLCSETASYLNDLAATLNGEVRPDIGLAEEAAEFLGRIIETNLDGGKWAVSNTAHLTVSGDHPDMVKKAAHSYTPSKDFSPDWGDEAPAIGQDSMDYKSGKHARKMRNDSWGQEGPAGDVFPKLKNPYIPKPFGDYTMKGEKGVDKENTGFGMWKNDDTWPNLDNPYTPKEAGGTGGKGYKMKDGKETDLVVDV